MVVRVGKMRRKKEKGETERERDAGWIERKEKNSTCKICVLVSRL